MNTQRSAFFCLQRPGIKVPPYTAKYFCQKRLHNLSPMFKQILLVILFDRDLENPHQYIFMNFMLCVCVVTSVESEVWAHVCRNIPVEFIGHSSAVSPCPSYWRQHFRSQASCPLSSGHSPAFISHLPLGACLNSRLQISGCHTCGPSTFTH